MQLESWNCLRLQPARLLAGDEVARTIGPKAPFWANLILFVLVAGFAPALFAQSTASFTGRVTDSTGAVITKARITLHDVNTNVERSTKTTNSGVYTIPYLQPGQYTVTAEAPGFKQEKKINLTLTTAQVFELDFVLPVGDVNTVVTVSAYDILDRGKADRGELIERDRVNEMPLLGSNTTSLYRLAPGTFYNGQFTNGIQWQRPFDGGIFVGFNANGGNPRGASYNTNVMIDGTPDQTSRPQNTAHHDVAYVVNNESVQEFNVIANPYDATYGRTRNGVIDITLKSGTNKLHGGVYEYYRRSWMDANMWVNNFHGTPRQAHNLDQYGAELDGPVVLPKLYDGRDRTFFLVEVQNWNESVPQTPVTTGVPDPAWLNGDFSSTISGGQPVTIYNPFAGFTTNTNGQLVRYPFAGNKIPTSMMNPVALKILSYYPKPNLPGDPNNTGALNYYFTHNEIDTYRNALIKLDHNLTNRDRITLRYGYWERYETINNNGVFNDAASGEMPLGDRSHTAAAQWTHTFTPNLLSDLRAMLNTKGVIIFNGPSSYNLQNGLSLPADLTQQIGTFQQYRQFPSIGISGANGFGLVGLGAGGNGETVSNSLSIFPSVTWVKQRHTFHFGGDLRFFQYGVPINGSNGFSMSFNQQWTQSCWSCGAGSNWQGSDTGREGNSIASMLLGTPSSGSASIAPTQFWTYYYLAPFVQDDWRVSRRLTLNLGVRWDVQSAKQDRFNGGMYSFDTTSVNPVDSMLTSHTLPSGMSIPTLVGGMTFLGVNGNPRRSFATTWLNIQPRAGFAYAITDRTVVRGGVGEYFQSADDQFANTAGFSASTSLINSNNSGLTPLTYADGSQVLSDPFPTGSVLQPTESSRGLLTQLGQGPFFQNPHFRITPTWSYSLGIQRQLTKHDLIDISYVGNRELHRYESFNINHWGSRPGYEHAEAQCDPWQSGANAIDVCNGNYPSNPKSVLGYMTNPFNTSQLTGLPSYGNPFKGSGLDTSGTIQGLRFTELMPEFGGLTEWGWQGDSNTDPRSWYNSLQAVFDHKTSYGLSLHGAYTWSKMMNAGTYVDNNYMILQRQLDQSDIPQLANLSAVWRLPVGRGQALLGHSNWIVDTLAGGWSVSPMAIFASGTPFMIPGGWLYVHSAKIKPFKITSGTYKGNIQGYDACYWTTNSETGVSSASANTQNYMARNPGACAAGPDFVQIPSYGQQPNIIYSGIRQLSGKFLDTNLSKNFKVRENTTLQLRLETFNTLNHPLFQNGWWNGDSATAGQVGAATGGGQSNMPRQTQLVAKFNW